MNFNVSPEQRQKYALGALALVALIGIVFYWYVYLKDKTFSLFQQNAAPPQEVHIDFGIFENPILQELGVPISDIPSSQPAARENPFRLPASQEIQPEQVEKGQAETEEVQ